MKEKNYQIEPACEQDFDEITQVWERSVRATHDFLSEEDISNIRSEVRNEFLPKVELWIIRKEGNIAAFAGIDGDKLEMLFADPDVIGSGYGTALTEFAIGRGVTLVDVNEDNKAGYEFYIRKGFKVVSRQEMDFSGRSYPILNLKLER